MNLPNETHPTILDPKPLPKPFITKDGYAAVECGKGLMLIYNNEQLKFFKTEKAARTYVNKLRKGKSVAVLPI